jgi:2,4-dienoyl-CoA reductase-like NADH-dependent reductase (Old Yellow Enzyme family)/thioredoxin reductase
MSKKYQNMLSPIKVGNIVFKNRLIASRSSPIFVQGNETYPTEATITHYANKARNGVAVVTCSGVGLPHHIPDEELESLTPERVLPGSFDTSDETCRRYLSQLADAIHFYGAKASMQIGGFVPPRYDVSAGVPDMGGRTGEEIPVSVINEVAEDYARQAALMKELGFDMVYLHMAYRLTIMGRFLSPLSNKRTDQYGGSLKNRARFAIQVGDLIKQKCGKDFITEASICGAETAGGFMLEDTIEYARMFAGHIDLLQVRAADMDEAHPTGFLRNPTPFLYMAEAIKKSGAAIGVVTIGGYQDPDICEEVIATGKADFIGMSRGLISNPEYGRLAYEDRGEDIVPCLRCNACLRSSNADPLISVCAVNPTWGLEHKIERMITLPGKKKKIAIAGGGPAGMEAALVAAARGHEVIIYEKSNALGGLLKTTDNVSFKWPQRDFKNYLIRQIAKSKVRVCLNTEATPDMLKDGEYDAILAALGSEPIIPQIPGAGGKNVVTAPDVYENEAALAKKLVIIGGGEVGVETGMHLAENGHDVTLIEALDKLAPNAPPAHYYGQFRDAWEKLPNFKYILKARCESIRANEVTYSDAYGAEHSIEAGSVVLAVGMKPKNDLSLKFYGAADRFFMIGDCNGVGNVQKVMRNAFSVASML